VGHVANSKLLSEYLSEMAEKNPEKN